MKKTVKLTIHAEIEAKSLSEALKIVSKITELKNQKVVRAVLTKEGE